MVEQSDIKSIYEKNLNGKVPKIVGIGKNYQEKPEKPILFTKSFNCLTREKIITFSPEIQINFELELGVVIGKTGKQIKKENYLDYIGGYFLTQDLTAESILNQLRPLKQDWYMAKGIDNFLPISDFIEKEKVPDPHKVFLRYLVNGVEKYVTQTGTMKYNIAEQLEYISQYVTLNPGDLILTGTPLWGPVTRGDVLEGYLLDESKQNVISSLTVQIK